MIHQIFNNNQLVLASASPRRVRIFQMLGLKFVIKPARIDEAISTDNPRKLVITHATQKAKAVADEFDSSVCVVGADTVVYIDGKILGKPENHQQAITYLQMLSNKKHAVYTGICLVRGKKIVSGWERTYVYFDQLSPADIEDYIATGEPLDKAGAYGIQGYGSQFITKLTGCYFNVMGFPVHLFNQLLKEFS
ncbi:MAG: Maf family protein [Candidatus Cloacimonetes bacterium]|nr:Maf family protein [Candidatus Cloacimonadota bacterium]